MAFRRFLVPDWQRYALLLAIPVAVIAGLAAVVLFGSPAASGPGAPVAGRAAPGAPRPQAQPAPGADAGTALPPPGGLLVQVTGAVVNPGLYRLAKGERVMAAVAAASGLASDADPDRTPMAARLRDGQLVRVPARGEPGTSARAGAATKFGLNEATAEQLATVPGISPELAVAVVERRSAFGPFVSLRELVTGLGMGGADYRLAKPHLRL